MHTTAFVSLPIFPLSFQFKRFNAHERYIKTINVVNKRIEFDSVNVASCRCWCFLHGVGSRHICLMLCDIARRSRFSLLLTSNIVYTQIIVIFRCERIIDNDRSMWFAPQNMQTYTFWSPMTTDSQDTNLLRALMKTIVTMYKNMTIIVLFSFLFRMEREKKKCSSERHDRVWDIEIKPRWKRGNIEIVKFTRTMDAFEISHMNDLFQLFWSVIYAFTHCSLISLSVNSKQSCSFL